MILNCLGSGSKGNCYHIQLGDCNFLLDAGIRLDKVYKSVDLNKVDFCFISHQHKDHSAYASKLSFSGVQLLGMNNLSDLQKNSFVGKTGVEYETIMFPIKHGDTPNKGIIVKNVDSGESLIYLTDLMAMDYDFKDMNIDHIFIECNYIEDLIEDACDEENRYRRLRQINTHLGLNGTIYYLKDRFNLDYAKDIYLIHCSQEYGDIVKMGVIISQMFNKPTYVCKQEGGFNRYGS